MCKIIFACTSYFYVRDIIFNKKTRSTFVYELSIFMRYASYIIRSYTSYFTLKCSKVFSHNTSLPIPLLLQFLKCFVIVSLVAYEIFFKVSWSPPDHFDNLAFVPTKLLDILDEFHIFYSCKLHDHCNNHQHTTKSNYH